MVVGIKTVLVDGSVSTADGPDQVVMANVTREYREHKVISVPIQWSEGG